jgi:hypothetical protein
LWLILALAILFVVWAIGIERTGRFWGILIDGRRKFSLSRLQLILWMAVVLSAFAVIALPRGLRADYLDSEVKFEQYQSLQKQDDARAKMCFPDIPEDASAETMIAVADECKDPLAVNIPGEMLVILGIASASTAGSVIVKSIKQSKEIDVETLRKKKVEAQGQLTLAQGAKVAADEKAQQATQALALAKQSGNQAAIIQAQNMVTKAIAEQVKAQSEYDSALKDVESAQARLDAALEAQKQGAGLLHRNPEFKDARWADFFRGEQVGNEHITDVAKVQMFFFTIVLIVVYAASVAGLLANTAAMRNPMGVDLPTLTTGAFSLLGISHVGYLTVKSVDETETKKQS